MYSFPSKTTKAEVLSAYRALERENEDLKKRLFQFSTPAATSIVASDEDISAVAAALRSMQEKLRNAVGSYQNTVANELIQLQELRSHLDKELGELQTLHGITLDDGKTLGSLIQVYEDYVESARIYDAETTDSAQSALLKLEEDWNSEKNRRGMHVEQQNEDRKLELKRNVEEYQYTRAKVEAIDRDADEQSQKAFEAETAGLKASYEQRWQQTDSELTERENACQKVREESTVLQAKLDRALKTATAEGEAIGRRNAGIQTRLAKTTQDAEASQKDITIEALNEQGKVDHDRILSLQASLNRINEDNQKLSTGALASMSGGTRLAMELAERVAIEQARSTGGKR